MKKTTIQKTLFKAFVLIIICVAFLMNMTYLVKDAPKIQAQTFDTLEQNCQNMQDSIDESIYDMKTICIDITYSNIFRTMAQQINFSDYTKNPEITDMLLSLLGSNTNIDQIYLYNSTGVLEYGLLEGYSVTEHSKQFWVDKINDENSVSFVYNSGYDNAISNLLTGRFDKNFISYILKYYDAYSKESGFIELKQSIGTTLNCVTSFESSHGENLCVFDYDGSVLYSSANEVSSHLYDIAKENNFPSRIKKVNVDGENQFIVCDKSYQSGIVSVMLISQEKILSPVFSYCLGNFLIALLCISLAMPIAFLSAKKLTTPISKVRDMAQYNNINNVPDNINLETDIIELEEMANSINSMKNELHDSMKKQILLQTQKMQSHMLALQSQMNPHFLYNSLATIQAMADEGMTDEIIHMCQSMSNILRYIASNKSETVPIHEELKYTKDYLECMKIRFQGDLFYNIEMQDESVNIKIPKLAIQQIVENAVKYASTGKAPYVITINSTVDKEKGIYQVAIKDNGPGFDTNRLEELNNKMETIKNTNLLPSLEINGMGILNVFIRIRLFHGEHGFLNIKNNEKAGACVMIGGPYEEK